jgi:Asp-tRNA(Asn)/Glu-tRNA(Gln) amidotransferase A subunit family amidase
MKRVSRLTGRGDLGSYDVHERAHSFLQQRQAFVNGDLTPRAYLERLLETMAQREALVQAFCYVDIEQARKEADNSSRRYVRNQPLSLLDGCVIGVKDAIDVRGMPSSMNSPLIGAEPAQIDAACIWALRNAGVIVLGKTHVPELCMGNVPPTRNPYHRRRTPGGSSSGSAAAVGARMVPMALGNQTQGSLIRPSSYNGVYGFKASYGAINIMGSFPLALSQDHNGPIANTLVDATTLAWEISNRVGGHNGHPGLEGADAFPGPQRPAKLCLIRTAGWGETDAATRDAFEEVLLSLGSAGVTIVDEHSDPMIAKLEKFLVSEDPVAKAIISFEGMWPLAALVEAKGQHLVSAAIKAQLTERAKVSLSQYRDALSRRHELRGLVNEISEKYDAFVTLSSSGPAPIDQIESGEAPDGIAPQDLTGSRTFLSPWSMVGGPAFNLPLMSVDQMPVGMQLMGAPNTDLKLTSIARWIDEQFS